MVTGSAGLIVNGFFLARHTQFTNTITMVRDANAEQEILKGQIKNASKDLAAKARPVVACMCILHDAAIFACKITGPNTPYS